MTKQKVLDELNSQLTITNRYLLEYSAQNEFMVREYDKRKELLDYLIKVVTEHGE